MASSEALSPFRIEIGDELIDDLRQRLARTRWPDEETVEDWSQGIPLAYVRELCEYWASGYDMRRLATRLNALPQFRAELDGLGIHVIHARSDDPGATPLIMTHGWPGSLVEFLDVIEPLREDFHVVCPALPGYGFSDKPPGPGFGVERIAELWARLMARLGYERYMAQGGDWGSMVTAMLGALDPEHVLGIHLNLAAASPEALMALGEPTEEEQAQLALLMRYREWEAGYSEQQSTRPQTLGYGLADSPAAQCAWIVEKFHAWTDNEGRPEDAVSRDDLLDNVMMYWVPNAGTSSARLYWESFRWALTASEPVTTPSAYSVFPQELFRYSERWARTRLTDLRYYGTVDEGGHFAALEQPELFVAEVRRARDALLA